MELQLLTCLTMHNSLPVQILASEPHLGKRFTLPEGASLAEALAPNADEFIVVEDGAIALFAQSGAGERFYLTILSAGYVFTPERMSAVLSDQERFGTEAMRDVLIRRISRQHWINASKLYPDLYNWMIEQEEQQLQIVQFHLAQHWRRSSIERTRFALCAYALSLGKAHTCGSRTIRVSRAELASWIGVSSDRMCRLIRTLHDAGEVTVIGRSIKVSNNLISSLYASAY